MPFCTNDQQDTVVTNLEHRSNAVRNNDLINLAMHVIPEQLPANRCFHFFLQPETEDVWLEATTGVIARQITKGWAIRRDNLRNHNGALQELNKQGASFDDRDQNQLEAIAALMLPSIRTIYENRNLVSRIRQLESEIEALKTLQATRCSSRLAA